MLFLDGLKGSDIIPALWVLANRMHTNHEDGQHWRVVTASGLLAIFPLWDLLAIFLALSPSLTHEETAMFLMINLLSFSSCTLPIFCTNTPCYIDIFHRLYNLGVDSELMWWILSLYETVNGCVHTPKGVLKPVHSTKQQCPLLRCCSDSTQMRSQISLTKVRGRCRGA